HAAGGGIPRVRENQRQVEGAGHLLDSRRDGCGAEAARGRQIAFDFAPSAHGQGLISLSVLSLRYLSLLASSLYRVVISLFGSRHLQGTNAFVTSGHEERLALGAD